MIKDFVLCARAVKQNKLLVELELSVPLLATRSTSISPEQPNRLLTHLHNRVAMAEYIQDQHSIYVDPSNKLTTEHNLIIHKKLTIAHDGTCFAITHHNSTVN